MGGELRVLVVAPGAPHPRRMSTVLAHAAPARYRRQTPSVWQAFGHAVWSALEGLGQRRAARELHALAQRWADIDPALAAQLSAAARSTSTNELKEPKS